MSPCETGRPTGGAQGGLPVVLGFSCIVRQLLDLQLSPFRLPRTRLGERHRICYCRSCWCGRIALRFPTPRSAFFPTPYLLVLAGTVCTTGPPTMSPAAAAASAADPPPPPLQQPQQRRRRVPHLALPAPVLLTLRSRLPPVTLPAARGGQRRLSRRRRRRPLICIRCLASARIQAAAGAPCRLRR
jgi:hypothetical protein